MEQLYWLIGSDESSILWWQMVIRGVLIFLYTLLLVRFGGRRVFGKNTSFDIVLGVILGSIMSRALTANAPFFPTIAAATALVLLHRSMGMLAQHSRTFGQLIKGTKVKLIEDGVVLQTALKRMNMTDHDLNESLRLSGGTNEVETVKAAYLERSGKVSVIKK